MVKAYTQILIEPHVLELLKKLKTKNSYSKEIEDFLIIKGKLLNNEKIKKNDLDILY